MAMALESFLEEVTLTSPGPGQPSDDTESQKPNKQWVGTETKRLLPLAKPIFSSDILAAALGCCHLAAEWKLR